MELVIMAAGMGSRFGGLKQLEPVDENGNFIIDYSIYDAIRYGFNKVVIIVKKENLEAFRETIGRRIEKHIETKYVFQNNDNFPENIVIPNTRTKPFGTGHAVLCAKDEVSSNFAVINADDFYGNNAFEVVAKFLKNNNQPDRYALVGFEANNTIGESGSVKRGICKQTNGTLETITESSITKTDDGKLVAHAIDGTDATEKEIAPNTIVSMNMFGFTKEFFNHLDFYFNEFLNENKNNLETCEYFLPTVVDKLIKENKVSVDVLNTSSKWFGITYKEDKDEVVAALKKMAEDGIYPKNLWNN